MKHYIMAIIWLLIAIWNAHSAITFDNKLFVAISGCVTIWCFIFLNHHVKYFLDKQEKKEE